MKNLAITCFLILFASSFAWGQDIWMHPNAGQWDDRIVYKVELTQGDMFIEKDGFTFYLNDGKQLLSHADHEHSHSEHAHHAADSMQVHNIQSKSMSQFFVQALSCT